MSEVTNVEQQQQEQHAPVGEGSNQHETSTFAESNYFTLDEYIDFLSQLCSPSRDVDQNNVGDENGSGNSATSHPSQHPEHSPPELTNAINSTSPQKPPLQGEKCGAVYEDPNQLGEHVRASHSNSPACYSAQLQSQQLGNSYQQQNQQLYTSSPQTGQQPQQQGDDYNGGQVPKSEVEQKPKEQAAILDLDSHEAQTRKYEEELMRLCQQLLEPQMQMNQQQVMQHPQHPQQGSGAQSVSYTQSWPPAAQPHESHPGLSPMGPTNNAPSIGNQGRFMRGQHVPVAAPQLAGPSTISSVQMASHRVPIGSLQPPKPPSSANQSWLRNVAHRQKTHGCTTCNKWFTSLGHLERHYNSILHRNAVKQSNKPDPANLPKIAHSYPGQANADHSSSGIGAGQSRPLEPSFLGSSLNSMAGPSGEAANGLLQTPATLYDANSSSSRGPSRRGVPVIHQLQQSPSGLHSSPRMLPPINSPAQFPMTGHHPKQMGPQFPLMTHHQPQQRFQLLPISSPAGLLLHSSKGSSSHQHRMTLPSPMTSGSIRPAMAFPPAMRGSTMPHQAYPNALPTRIAVIPSLQESIDMQPTTAGNELSQASSDQHQRQQQTQNMLPGFGTFSKHRMSLPRFAQFTTAGCPVGQNQPQAVNVNGLCAKENAPPENRSFESRGSTCNPYRGSLPPYESLTNMNAAAMPNTDGTVGKRFEIQSHHPSPAQDHLRLEADNGPPRVGLAKEELDPNVENYPESQLASATTMEHQVTSTNNGSLYISQDGFHKCIDCDKTFNKACYLTQHNKSFHSGDKPFKCNQCGKRFSLEYLFAEHLTKHAGDKPYKCQLCPKQFNHKTDLRRHMCLHSGDKPYVCENCGKGFIRKDHMMKHLETHWRKSNHNLNLRA